MFPLLKSTDESLMDRLKNYKTLVYPEIDRKRGLMKLLIAQFIKIMLSVRMVKHQE